MGLQSALVVDDSRSARFALRSLLEHQKIRVDTAATPQQALDYLRSNRPDVVFMDDLMPGMDGLQVIDQLANDPQTARIPIVMYTGREDRVSLNQALKRGVVGILSKPFTPEDVNRLLERLGHDPNHPDLMPEPKVARLVRNTTEVPVLESVVSAEDYAPAAVAAQAAGMADDDLEGLDEPDYALEEIEIEDTQPDTVSEADPVAAADIRAEPQMAVTLEEATEETAELATEADTLVADTADLPAVQGERLPSTGLSAEEMESLRAQLVQVVKGETRLAVAQLVGELLEQQVSNQIRQREGTWRRALDGMRSDQERFQVQVLEERVPRLLDLLEGRIEQRFTRLQTSVNEKLDGGNLTPLQRTMVSHVARTAAAEAAQRPARQSARRVAAEFVRNDLNNVNQNFERLRQRFNWLVIAGVVVMLSVGVLAYLLGSQKVF